jgi:hypothetical protein
VSATITPTQEFAIISAGALMAQYAGELSDFEVDTIATVARRWLDNRSATVITAAEWMVVDDAVAAMRAAAMPTSRRAA